MIQPIYCKIFLGSSEVKYICQCYINDTIVQVLSWTEWNALRWKNESRT